MLTAAEVRAGPHLSVSQLTTWLQCPRKYRFQYLDQLPWPAVPSALVFGSAVHAAIGAYHEASLQGTPVGEEELLAVFRDSWATEDRPIDFRRGETPLSLEELAGALFGAFLRTVEPAEVLGVEEPFRVHLVEGLPPMVGFIDLIERRDGRVTIVEYKTAAQRYSSQRVRNDLQLSAYALAACEMDLPGVEGPDDLALEFRVLLKTSRPTMDVRPARRSIDQLGEFRDTAVAIRRGVDAGVFPRNRGWQCAGCPFRQACEG